MATTLEDALDSQTALLNKFAEIVRALIKQVSTLQTDKDAALAKLATLLGIDESLANGILASNPHIQALIDEAAAALPSTPSDGSDDDTAIITSPG